ncbi:MAG: hypothetical protein LUF30_05360, partial [Lachnospiraceae bacterium]|nr:hypothetical protein [Lachnospiraceae bacterium]
MYYEEDFLNADGNTMISYTTGSWDTKGEAESDPQEPGVVGTTGDSPYGSDEAYLADTGDSNGSSKYVSTENSSASFSYTFTGTGTSFFARTTNNSGYMRVRIYSGNTVVHEEIIDTRYLNTGSDTLYNIPVFTWDAVDDDLSYDTYTVKVNLATSGSKVAYGTDFWLDGIRVQNPMNEESTNYSIAQSAYSADGEANVNIVTLRDKVIDASGEDENGNLVWKDGYAVLTDINKNIVSASDYESIGPNEEVYLAGTDYSGASNAQTITFKLKNWNMNYSLYLGLKSPTGNDATITINGHVLTVSNTADCYYDISSYLTVDSTNSDGSVNVSVTITCTAGLVSITNIKTTGTLQFEIIQGTDLDGDEDESEDETESETEEGTDITIEEMVEVDDPSVASVDCEETETESSTESTTEAVTEDVASEGDS